MTQRGQGMAADIAEQPAGFARLLEGEHAGAIAEVAATIAERDPRHVVFVGRGTSDHAALYGAYLTEIRLGLPVASASPSAGGIVVGGGTFAAGSSQTVTATANGGYSFVNWTANGSVGSGRLPSRSASFRDASRMRRPNRRRCSR